MQKSCYSLLILFKEYTQPFVFGIFGCFNLLTGHNFLNWHLTVRSFHYSLHERCTLFSGCALGPFRYLSIGQLTAACPAWKRREQPLLAVATLGCCLISVILLRFTTDQPCNKTLRVRLALVTYTRQSAQVQDISVSILVIPELTNCKITSLKL